MIFSDASIIWTLPNYVFKIVSLNPPVLRIYTVFGFTRNIVFSAASSLCSFFTALPDDQQYGLVSYLNFDGHLASFESWFHHVCRGVAIMSLHTVNKLFHNFLHTNGILNAVKTNFGNYLSTGDRLDAQGNSNTYLSSRTIFTFADCEGRWYEAHVQVIFLTNILLYFYILFLFCRMWRKGRSLFTMTTGIKLQNAVLVDLYVLYRSDLDSVTLSDVDFLFSCFCLMFSREALT